MKFIDEKDKENLPIAELAKEIFTAIVSSGGYNQTTGVTHFVPAEIASKKSWEYALEFSNFLHTKGIVL